MAKLCAKGKAAAKRAVSNTGPSPTMVKTIVKKKKS